jgi:hypothetical protein
MTSPLDQILNILDEECQGRILIFLKSLGNPFSNPCLRLPAGRQGEQACDRRTFFWKEMLQ